MFRFNRISIGVVALAFIFAGDQTNADITSTTKCVQSLCYISNLKLSGVIEQSTYQDIKEIIEHFKKNNGSGSPNDLSGTKIELNSPGGSVQSAIAIGRLLRDERIGAVILPGKSCISACVLIYAGAVSRFGSNPKARLGIHQPYFDFETTSASSSDVRRQYSKLKDEIVLYLKEMNVSARLAEDMLRISPSAVRFLTPSEQDDYGLVILDPIEREVLSVEETKRLGISRSELIRRESFSRNVCFNTTVDLECHRQIMDTGKNPYAIDLSKFGTPVK